MGVFGVCVCAGCVWGVCRVCVWVRFSDRPIVVN